MSEINNRIKMIVEQYAKTKTEFAKKINVSQQHVSRLSIDGTPSDRTIIDISEKFGISEEWIRTGNGPMVIKKTKEEELHSFFGSLINDDVPFRTEIIYALSKMPPEWWELTGKMIQDAADAMEKSQESE